MHISINWKVLLLAVFVSGTRCEWEVLNDDGESRMDRNVEAFDLRQENLLPVDYATVRVNKARQRSLSSLNENGKENIHQTDLKVEAAHNQSPAATTTNTDSKKINGVKSMTLNHDSSSDKPESSKSDDVIDLVGEGLLSVENTNKKNAHNGRKLSQVKEEASQSIKVTNVDKHNSDGQIMAQQQESRDQQTQHGSLPDKNFDLSSLKVACVYENSWECLMFKEDFLAMQGDVNLSRRATAHEIAKRQSSSNYAVSETMNSGNTRNLLLDCEGDDCLSGNGTVPDEETKGAPFRIKGSTRMRPPNNMTESDLTNDTKEALAKEFEAELTKIFGNIPGFKNVKINPKNIHFDNDGNLVVDKWIVNIDGGNPNYSGNTGPEVGDKVANALKDANEKYKNMTVRGMTPLDDFNSTKAAEDVAEQAKDPCNMKPNPCSRGYGRCVVLRGNYNDLDGIRVKCKENCVDFSNECARHGICDKDSSGNAFCNCSGNWVGLNCDIKDTTETNKDKFNVPDYTVKMHSVFPKSNLTPNDLTPEKRKQLADDFTKKMKELMKDIPGFKNIKVDPNDITIDKNGQLYIPWNLKLNPAGPLFTGKTPQEIADIISDAIKNVGKAYRNSTLVDGLSPIADLDFGDASDQIVQQAEDPCSTNPCNVGYDNCQAINATLVKCVHNCNALPVTCQNGGKCQLNGKGKAVCQCTQKWKGDTCEKKSNKFEPGQIAGIVIGCALMLAGIIGALLWFLLCARRNKPINFTNYTDQEGSMGPTGGASPFVIDRPQINSSRLPLFSQSGPNSRNFSRSSSYEQPSISA